MRSRDSAYRQLLSVPIPVEQHNRNGMSDKVFVGRSLTSRFLIERYYLKNKEYMPDNINVEALQNM